MLSGSVRFRMLQLCEQAVAADAREWDKAEPEARVSALKKVFNYIVTRLKPLEPGADKDLKSLFQGAEKIDSGELSNRLADILEVFRINLESFFRVLARAL